MNSQFVTNLRNLRQSKQFTQAELGEIATLSGCIIAHYEAGRRSPGLPNLIKIKKALGCKWEELLD